MDYIAMSKYLEGESSMASGRNYTVTMRTGKDGTQYLRIRETPPAHGRPVAPLGVDLCREPELAQGQLPESIQVRQPARMNVVKLNIYVLNPFEGR